MKTFLSLLFLFGSFCGYSQDISGEWHGNLKVMGTSLALNFDFQKAGYKWTGTMSVPQQNAKGIPLTSVTNEDNGLQFLFDAAGITFNGKWNEKQEIEGTFIQNGQNFPLVLTRENNDVTKINRPQEPKEPFPYSSEEVTFENPKAKITLAGTLTLPKVDKPCPVVVLISGSGPQDRNSEIFNHKPFWVIADHLSRNGIGVLRVDDRGIGKSTGNQNQATSLDFASDVQAAVTFLKTKSGVNHKKIGLIGHSEGALIAPIVASKDPSIAYIVLMAGPGVPCDELLLEQAYLIGKSEGLNETDLEKAKKVNQKIYNSVKSEKSTEEVKLEIEKLLEQNLSDNPEANYLSETQKKQMISQQKEQITSPWFRYFMKFNPDEFLSKIKCPVLILNGDKDLQVPAKMNTQGIQNSLAKAGNKKATTIVYPNKNHLFQECTTGSVNEYRTIEQTISPQVLTDITTWIEKQTK